MLEGQCLSKELARKWCCKERGGSTDGEFLHLRRGSARRNGREVRQRLRKGKGGSKKDHGHGELVELLSGCC
jgi:hypothetical protein